jgi:hypothetical protein
MQIIRSAAFSVQIGAPETILNFQEYSQFKYGHKPTILKFAKKMVDGLFAIMPISKLIKNNQDIVIITSPFWHTPPSVYPLALEVHKLINEKLLDNKANAIKFVKISRSSAPSCDFSKLTVEERKLNMQRNKLSIDEDSVRDKTVIFIEDARITGAHEEKTIVCLEQAGAKKVILLYLIDVKNGKNDPDIENRLNHAVINSIDELYKLMRKPDEYVLNSRSVRFVLSWADHKELKKFFAKISSVILDELYSASITDGYGLMEKYAQGFELLRAEVKSRNKQQLVPSLINKANAFIKKAYVLTF